MKIWKKMYLKKLKIRQIFSTKSDFAQTALKTSAKTETIYT